jgi:hypothetical protein
MKKYEDWSKVLIEPQTLNEARLYALETRIHEEEELRIKEFNRVKDYFTKLLFTLDEHGGISKLKLPEITSPNANSSKAALFSKRLEFLKQSIGEY